MQQKVHFYEEKKSKRRQKPKLFIIFAALKHSEPLQRETNSDFRFSQTSLIHHLKIIAFVKFPTPASQLQPYVFQRIKLKNHAFIRLQLSFLTR